MDEAQRSKQLLKEVSERLAPRLGMTPEEMPRLGKWSESGNAIGVIALRLKVLKLEQIDEILREQQTRRELFGQLAIRLGYVSQAQVERLLEIQRFHRCLELCELLVVEGRTDLATCIGLLADCLRSAAQGDVKA